MNRFVKAIIFGISLVALISIFDFFIYPTSFWLYGYALGAVFALAYYFFVYRDASEAIAIFLAFFIMLWTGLEDLVFYLIRPLFQPEHAWGIPATMDHLYTHPVMGVISKTMGLSTVTPVALIISVLIGGVAAYYVVNYLRGI